MLRRFLFPLIALVALSPPFLCAQSKASGAIPSTGGGTACVSINVDAQSTVGIQVTGTWTGTLQPKISVQGQAAANTQVTPSTSATAASTITANGVYRSSVAGGSTFLLCGNTVASGTANVFLNATTASAGSGLSGGGTGTVTAVLGTTNQITSDGNTATPTLSLPSTVVAPGSVQATTGLISGANGGTAGSVSLNGSTSGAATLTAPPVAGTITNPFSISNSLSFPTGTAISWNSDTGLSRTAAGQIGVGTGAAGSTAGTLYASGIRFDDGLGINLANAATWRADGTHIGITFSNSNSTFVGVTNFAWFAGAGGSAGTLDTNLSRTAAKVVAIGNGTNGDETGLLRTGMPCRIAADVALTVNTANSFCSWSLPAVAKSWAWTCDIQWAITAGSGTNTLAVGVNASQTPTATTNGFAQIYTTTSGTQTMAPGIAISASGAINLLTSPTYTPAAQVLFAHTSGTIAASGTAGTFAVTAAANGTTATAAVKAGSTCMLY